MGAVVTEDTRGRLAWLLLVVVTGAVIVIVVLAAAALLSRLLGWT